MGSQQTDAALGFAKKGLGMMLSVGKAAASAISAGVQKARKGYANKHETGVLIELRSKGLAPVEHLMRALQRFYFLMMAGYKHEIQAAALLSAKRLVEKGNEADSMFQRFLRAILGDLPAPKNEYQIFVHEAPTKEAGSIEEMEEDLADQACEVRSHI